jgi:hypothetical protein
MYLILSRYLYIDVHQLLKVKTLQELMSILFWTFSATLLLYFESYLESMFGVTGKNVNEAHNFMHLDTTK